MSTIQRKERTSEEGRTDRNLVDSAASSAQSPPALLRRFPRVQTHEKLQHHDD